MGRKDRKKGRAGLREANKGLILFPSFPALPNSYP